MKLEFCLTANSLILKHRIYFKLSAKNYWNYFHIKLWTSIISFIAITCSIHIFEETSRNDIWSNCHCHTQFPMNTEWKREFINSWMSEDRRSIGRMSVWWVTLPGLSRRALGNRVQGNICKIVRYIVKWW